LRGGVFATGEAPTPYLLQGGPHGRAVLLVDAVPLQTGHHLQLLVGPERQQVDEPVPEGPLGHRVIGKALADGVGWVDGRGALTLRDHVCPRQRRLTAMDLLSWREREEVKTSFEAFRVHTHVDQRISTTLKPNFHG